MHVHLWWGFAHRYGLLWCSSVFLWFALVIQVQAQLIPDNTLGKESSIVNSVDSLQRIDGGAIRNSNLFHSFQEFNINDGKSVYFSNPATIQNIFTRITGKNSSSIFGKLGVLGNANLFLINPNGIIFGENAKLDIGGSFIASTADNINFADSTKFSVTNPSATPILTISTPLGLQYGANPGNIDVRATLEVPESKSIGLVGGSIKLDGASLTAIGGEVDLIAIKNGQVSLTNSNGKIQLEATQGKEYSDIEILNGANLDASGKSGGGVRLRGRNITLKNESKISTNMEGNGSGEKLDIAATELLTINKSYLVADVALEASGSGGDLVIDSKHLLVTNGSVISSSTSGSGNAGALKIKASDIQIIDGSRLFALVRREASGNGGDVVVKTTNLRVKDGGQIAAATSGNGAAGNMQIQADLVELIGFTQSGDIPAKSGLFASAVREDGQGGNLNITANRLIIGDGATINASNFFSFDPENILGEAGMGGAGNININSPFVRLENQGIITANVNAGNKGNINIQSQNLQLRQGSLISTNAKNSADGGNINISTDTLVALENSDITANSEGSFGGRVIVNAKGILGTRFQQELTPKSDITATSSLGASFNGVVDINTIAYDPNSGLIELPQTFTDSNQKITVACAGSIGNNFIVRGRGGIPQKPEDLFNGNEIHTELLDLVTKKQNLSNIDDRNKLNNVNFQTKKIIEATEWVTDVDGNLRFIAKKPDFIQQVARFNSATCKSFSSANKYIN